MNLDAVTIQDCMDMIDRKGFVTVLNDGKVIGFKPEKNLQLDMNWRKENQSKR